jgi:hypothetical protein
VSRTAFAKLAALVSVVACLSAIPQPSTSPAAPPIGDEPPARQSRIFQDWPTPEAVFVFSGQQHGYLEPCGCSPEFQKGGLARRLGFINSLKQKKWPIVTADLGGLLEDTAQQPAEGKYMVGAEQLRIKLETALDALHRMKYDALNLAPEDLTDGFLSLVGLISNLDNPKPSALNANIKIDKVFFDDGFISPYVMREAGGVKLAIIGMLGEHFKDRVADQDLKEWQAPAKVLGKTLAEVKRSSDLQVLMLYGSLDEARKLADSFPDLDVIVYASDSEEPRSDPQWSSNKQTMLVTIGVKGKNAAVVGIFKNLPRLRFELVPLDDRFDEDKGIRELLDGPYIEKMKDQQLVQKSPKVASDKSNPALGFVGSEKCGECHKAVYAFWNDTRHAHALETLVNGFVAANGKKIAAGKQANPECVSCHTTGFFNTTGYDGTAATRHLGGNGCENCHRPGSEHARIMSGPAIDKKTFDLAKKTMHLPPQDKLNNVCKRCHDFENSPKFDIDVYWDKVAHGDAHLDDEDELKKIREKLFQDR